MTADILAQDLLNKSVFFSAKGCTLRGPQQLLGKGCPNRGPPVCVTRPPLTIYMLHHKTYI